MDFRIILHCFQYGRNKDKLLKQYCHQVYYYKRDKGLRFLFCGKPYIVATRSSGELLQRLMQDDYPILFEGLHTTYYLTHPKLENRFKIVRTHNIEHAYYNGLFHASNDIIKKLFFGWEALKLKGYEKVLKKADTLASISMGDQTYFSDHFNNSKLVFAFHPFEDVSSHTGKGDYFLYHGNLSVQENVNALKFLLKKVIPETNIKLVVAGKAPDEKLRRQIALTDNVELVADPQEERMNALIQEAHCIVIPTFQPTGLKLKLLSSLHLGRFVLTNDFMVKDTGLSGLCKIANTPKEFIAEINQIDQRVFSIEDIQERRKILSRYSNDTGGKAIADIIQYEKN